VKALVVPHSPHRVADLHHVHQIAYSVARQILKNKDANIIILETIDTRYGWVVVFAEVGCSEARGDSGHEL
jgi:hypothetical protein